MDCIGPYPMQSSELSWVSLFRVGSFEEVTAGAIRAGMDPPELCLHVSRVAFLKDLEPCPQHGVLGFVYPSTLGPMERATFVLVSCLLRRLYYNMNPGAILAQGTFAALGPQRPPSTFGKLIVNSRKHPSLLKRTQERQKCFDIQSTVFCSAFRQQPW